MRKWAAIWGLAGLLLVPAAAARSEESVLSAARQLGREGLELNDEGDFAGASEKLEQAYGALQVPTLGLWSARSLARIGKLVEASGRYLEVTRMELPKDASEVVVAAKESAVTEKKELATRIPKLTLRLADGPVGDTSIRLDETEILPAMIGVPIPVNPGAHQYRVRRGARETSGEFTLKERESRVVELALELEPSRAGVTKSNAAPAGGEPSGAGAPTVDRGAGAGSWRRTTGFVALGVGAAGLATGIGFDVLAMRRKSDLEESGLCEGNRCATAPGDDLARHTSNRVSSTVGFVVGGVAAAAGTVLIVTAPHSAADTALRPWVGFGSAGVRGRF